ncbi:MAG: CHAT domain-containing protein, partial [Microcoleaceae cyanobacterium]
TPTPEPTPTPTPTPNPTPTPEPTPTPTPTPNPTPTPEPTPTPTPTPNPTPTPTLPPTPTPTPNPTPTPTLPPTPTPPTLPPTPPTPLQRPSNSKEPQGNSAIAIERDSLGRDLEKDELDVETADLTTPLASEDYAFQVNDLDRTLWLLEHSLNQEFESYLGLESVPVRDRRAIQQVLKKVEAETGEVYVIVYLVARDEQLEVVLVTSSGSPIHRSVPEARAELLFPVIKALQGSIITPREQNTNRYQDSAKQLYDWILQPIEADLQNAGATTLLFSLGLGLRSLPIAALWDGEQFLIEKYNYSLIPSTSLISPTYTSLTEAAILAMGASQFSDQAPLPAVPLEVEKITEFWPGQVFLNESFTLSNLQVQRRLINYEVIHLATHADFQPGTPENSYIQLWDQKLPLSQLPDLNWDTPQLELLVLSACQTAIGDREAELGFAGLAVQAGAKSAIASLWNVSDEGTLGLMSEFYIELKTAPIKAAALRQAQIDMIRGKVRIESGQLITERSTLALPPELVDVNSQSLAHPYYWAGFTLIGTPW